MSRSVLSAKVFAVYLFIVGPVLVFAPNILLAIFRIAPVGDVWIRVVGLLALNIGVYLWRLADHRPFLEASVYTRVLVCAVFFMFALTGMADPMIALFGVIDLCGGLWTWFALKADARASAPALAGQP
ncbi:hypothetical protein [Massilia putida]|uniref:hypothetical protein n=1 Tax=Massilia putida TaxID=1141883 RepID=UPI0009520109|nr:hypothetical protein [Massilia putida]